MSLPIVPNGFGYGMDTRAAYGGATPPAILRVKNLNDSGPDSLRAALLTTGPRVVIFETSGTIVLNSDIYVVDPYLTVAGQTAPSPGITLRGYGIWVYSHDMLFQHFRIRPGDTGAVNTGQAIRAGVYQDGAYNLVFDHISVSWTNDEGTIVAKTFGGNSGTSDANVSFWRCLVGEGLNNTPREPGIEGKGLAVNYHSRKVSAIQNAYISTANRLPLVKGGASTYFTNNLVYNWSFNPPATFVDPVEDGIQNGPFFVSIIGNHYRTGPSWGPSGAYMAGSRYAQTGSQLYLSDNFKDAVGGTLNDFIVVGPDGIDPRVGSAPIALSGYTPIASSGVQALVLANAGARPVDRDSVDTRLVNDVTNRTGSSTIGSQSEVGGWPVLAVNTRSLTTPSNPHATSATGYTNLEDWLHGIANGVETTAPAPSNLPIVPGASGFGVDTRAAYGGATPPTIIRVKNINDSGPDSLRQAVQVATGPRVVIFETSGTIALTTELVITDPYITIAGQTAPSPGITIRNYGIQIQTHDVLIQHIRVRTGGDTCNVPIEAFQTGNPYNIFLDHLSVSWGQSKNFVFTNGTQDMNLTVWRSICSEPTYAAPGTGSCPSGGFGYAYGMLFRNQAKKAAVLQSLFAHCSERNPDSSGNAQTYSANNVIYDWQSLATFYEDPDGVEPPGLLASNVGNYYRAGPSTDQNSYIYGSRYLSTGAHVYINDNAFDGNGKTTNPFTIIGPDGIDPTVGVSSPPITVPNFTPQASSAIFPSVINNAGARPVDRDSVDTRVVSEVLQRTGGLVHHQNDVGGFPVLAVNTRVLTTPTNPNGISTTGYTNLEDWLHNYANDVEGGVVFVPPPPTVYYVSTTGNDTNNGTITNPWRTINASLTKLNRGDVLNVRAGTYSENISVSNIGTDWIPGSGAITVQAYQNEVVWVTPASGTSSIFFSGAAYNIWQNINIDGINLSGGYSGLVISDSHHIRFGGTTSQRSEIKNTYWSSVVLDDSGVGFDSIQLQKMFIHDGGRLASVASPAAGIFIGSSNNLDCHTLIQDVEVYNFNKTVLDAGFYVQSGTSAIRAINITYDRCSLHGNSYGALFSYVPSGGLTFTNNLVYVNTQGGVRLDQDITGCVLYNNTIHGNTGVGIEVGTLGASVSCLIKNNAITSNTGAPIKVFNTSATSKATIQFNDLNGNGNGNAILDQNAISTISNNITSVPGYTNAGAFDFSLAIGSALRDTGTNLSTVVTDYIKVPRPQVTQWDIGAYEYISSGGPALTLTAAPGAVALTGKAVSFVKGGAGSGSGSVLLTGGSASLFVSGSLTAQGASVLLTGGAASLFPSLRLSAASGSVLITGTAAGFSAGPVASAGTSVLLTGGAASLRVSGSLGAQGGSVALTGGAANLFPSGILTATGGSVVLSGTAATFSSTGATSAGASVLLTGGDATLLVKGSLAALASSVSLTGGDASFILSSSPSPLHIDGDMGLLLLSGGDVAFILSPLSPDPTPPPTPEPIIRWTSLWKLHKLDIKFKKEDTA